MIVIRFPLLILSVVFVSCSTLPKPETDSSHCVRKGDYYYSRGVLNRAFILYTQAWKNTGRVFNVYERLGRACMEMGDRDRALYFFTYSMKFYPRDYKPYMLAACITAEMDAEQASLLAQKASLLAPSSLREDVRKDCDALGIREREGVCAPDPDRAAQAVARGVMKGNRDVLVTAGNRLGMSERKTIFYKAADICLRKNDIESALVILEQIACIRGQSGAYIRMGNICFTHGKYSQAVHMYLRYAEESDKPELGYFNVAVVYCVKGFEQRSRKMFKKAGPEYRNATEDILARKKNGEQIRPLSREEDKHLNRH